MLDDGGGDGGQKVRCERDGQKSDTIPCAVCVACGSAGWDASAAHEEGKKQWKSQAMAEWASEQSAQARAEQRRALQE